MNKKIILWSLGSLGIILTTYVVYKSNNYKPILRSWELILAEKECDAKLNSNKSKDMDFIKGTAKILNSPGVSPEFFDSQSNYEYIRELDGSSVLETDIELTVFKTPTAAANYINYKRNQASSDRDSYKLIPIEPIGEDSFCSQWNVFSPDVIFKINNVCAKVSSNISLPLLNRCYYDEFSEKENIRIAHKQAEKIKRLLSSGKNETKINDDNISKVSNDKVTTTEKITEQEQLALQIEGSLYNKRLVGGWGYDKPYYLYDVNAKNNPITPLAGIVYDFKNNTGKNVEIIKTAEGKYNVTLKIIPKKVTLQKMIRDFRNALKELYIPKGNNDIPHDQENFFGELFIEAHKENFTGGTGGFPFKIVPIKVNQLMLKFYEKKDFEVKYDEYGNKISDAYTIVREVGTVAINKGAVDKFNWKNIKRIRVYKEVSNNLKIENTSGKWFRVD